MEGFDQFGRLRGKRVRGVLMMGCALVLFMLGVWLLIQPKNASRAGRRDNVSGASADVLMLGYSARTASE